MATYKQKVQEFQDVLEADAIDLKTLQKLSFGGCPFEKSIRSRCWKLLLNYLPLKRAEWKEHLQKQRQTYQQFIEEMIVQPGMQKFNSGGGGGGFEDHPLNPNPESNWSQYFKDNEMLLQIDKDCRRLYPDLAFFQQATPHPCKKLVQPEVGIETLRTRVEHTMLKAQDVSQNWQGITRTNPRRSRKSTDTIILLEGQEAHWEVVERILFIYAKLNPGQGYVQGMNEIIGPIYYTFASDPDPHCQEFAEADSFWCFTCLMAEIRDNFIKTLDDSECGIGKAMSNLFKLLKEQDDRVFHVFEEQDLKPQYFAFRWITLMLSQEFTLPDVLIIWDSLLADRHRFDFLIYVCCAMIILVRKELLMGDFTSNMKLMQNYPMIDVTKIIAKAEELYARATQNLSNRFPLAGPLHLVDG